MHCVSSIVKQIVGTKLHNVHFTSKHKSRNGAVTFPDIVYLLFLHSPPKRNCVMRL